MKVLLITDLFPPDNGGRADKMFRHAKYACKQGMQMDVLCPSTLASDASHLVGVGEARCFRVKPLLYKHLSSLKWQERFGVQDSFGRFLLRLKLPAGYLRWLWPAYKKAIELLSSNEYSSFITVSNPMGMQLLGLALRKRFPELGWVVEMRDPLVGYFRSRHFEFLNKYIEHQIAKKADGIAEWLDFSPSPLTSRHKEAEPKHRHISIVGYDPDEYLGLVAANRDEAASSLLKIVYTGGYYGELEQWQGFLGALSKSLRAGAPITFGHYGDWTDEQQRIREQYEELCGPEFILHGRQKKQVCVEATHNADILLYLLKESEENVRRVSSKFYDYTAAKRPILSMTPNGSLLEERLMEYCPELTLPASSDVQKIEGKFLEAFDLILEKHQANTLNELLEASSTALSCEQGEQTFIHLILSTVKN